MNRNKKKLGLRSEVVRGLNNLELNQIAGGMKPTFAECLSLGNNNCATKFTCPD